MSRCEMKKSSINCPFSENYGFAAFFLGQKNSFRPRIAKVIINKQRQK